MPSHVKVSGDWKEINGIYVNVAGDWKEVNAGYVRVSGAWKQFHPGIPSVPAGLIIPYNGLSAPAGWSAFTDANGNFIIGADGSTYVVKNTGGNDTIIQTLQTAGAHQGTDWAVKRYGGAAFYRYGVSTQGSHSHTCTISTPDLKPPYQNVYLIKADSEQSQFPIDAVVLAETDLAGLSNIWTASDLLRAFTDLNTGSDLSEAQGSTSAGAHRHSNSTSSYLNSGSTAPMEITTRGAHSHTPTFTFTQNAKRYKLSAWSHASAAFDLTTNMIGMYESMTPPAGWSLCDGNNGTPDLTTYFIGLEAAADDGSASGNNNWATSGSVSAGGSHRHLRINLGDIDVAGEHSDIKTFGAHTWNWAATWMPSWYALAFIMYTG